MTGLPALALVAALAAVVLGLPFGLYALLTRGRRQTMREIRLAASREGWQFHRSFFRGDPTEFEIDGRTHSGVPWSMKCRGTSGYDRGWTVRLALRFPTLGGVPDMAILPRDHGPSDIRALASEATPEITAKVANLSGIAADAVDLLKNAPENPSGLAEFDRAYLVTVAKDRFRVPLVDADLATRMLEWPTEAVKAHSVLAWRDPFGLHFQARLPGPPNWPTVSYFRELAEFLIVRVPAGTVPPETHGIVDKLAEKFLRS